MPSHHSLSYSVCTPPSVSPEGPHAVLSGLWRLWGFPYASGTRHFDCAVSVNLFPLHRPRLAVHFFLQVSRLQSVWTLPSFPLQHSGMNEVGNSGLPHPHPPFHAFAFFSGGASMTFFLVVPAPSHHLQCFLPEEGLFSSVLPQDLPVYLRTGEGSVFLKQQKAVSEENKVADGHEQRNCPSQPSSAPFSFPGVLSSVLGLS